MATVGDFIGSAAPGALTAAFGRGIMFDASLSASPGGLSYDAIGEFEQSGFQAGAALSAEATISAGVFEATLSAVSGLSAQNLGGGGFGASLRGAATLNAELFAGMSFEASLSGTSTLSGATQRGLIFEAALAGVNTLEAATEAPGVDGVTTAWAVNLTTGGHTRYVGALDGSTQIDAYFITGVSDLSKAQQKTVPDLYAQARIRGTMQITVLADEQEQVVLPEIGDNGKDGIHRRRCKGARGLKGNSFQFKGANIDGADFTLKQLEVVPVASMRRVT